jgi:hypothetical protein
MDIGGMSHDLLRVQVRHFPGRTEENMKILRLAGLHPRL